MISAILPSIPHLPMISKKLWAAIFLLMPLAVLSQDIDSTRKPTVFSGTWAVSSNGFSIVPAFSLNAPAALAIISWRRGKFSIDPDIRMTLNLTRGSMLLWFRYHAIEKKRFGLRVGAHPAINFLPREIETGNGTQTISQMRRFLAWELVPSYRISKRVSSGIDYLQGNGLQKDGPITTNYVNFNLSFTQIPLGRQLYTSFFPAAFYLNVDGNDGWYYAATALIGHRKLPVDFSSSINKTIRSNLPGNRDFLWNVGLNYRFRKLMYKAKR